MDVVILEAQEFVRIVAKIESLAAEVGTLRNEYADKGTKKWISSGEACRLLNVSFRTLQTYRDNGTLPYAQIGHKVFFRPSDIEKILNERRVDGKE